jgi:hypothetical protein
MCGLRSTSPVGLEPRWIDWQRRWDKNWEILMTVLHQEDIPLLRASLWCIPQQASPRPGRRAGRQSSRGRFRRLVQRASRASSTCIRAVR